MLETNSPPIKPRYGRKPNQAGVAAVEFALLAVLFFLIVLGIIELARVMYMYNTLPEVTRRVAREAANISFIDGSALNSARKRAVFAETTGALPFGSPVTFENIRLEWLYLPVNMSELKPIPTGSMPSCPARNRVNCMKDPNAANCIRAVQASICKDGQNGATCTPVDYQPLIPLINLPVKLPTALTIVSAETLGYKTGDVPCP
jgi:hypothetical protein